jgi:tetratricopeptide (TPR) repeat protein
MKPVKTQGHAETFPSVRTMLILSIAIIGIILLGIFSKMGGKAPSDSADLNGSSPTITSRSRQPAGESSRKRARIDRQQSAEEIVAGKVIKFGKNRRDLVHAIAKRSKVVVPDEVERFFDAVESGRWEEIDAAHKALLMDEKQLNQPLSAELHEIWRPIQEAWGAAREAHNWPAQRLLDYGNAILDSLHPGMIYAGGTDPGCFIPTMMNETGDGEQHIVLTQNALADGTYLKYLDVLYGERMATLTQDDSQRAFQEYVTDAQKRLEHDQQFPNESPKLKPGEDVKVVDGRIQVSGQVAVMAINEKLFQMLMAKNPDAAFAMEESFPFISLYANAKPLGPVIEMGSSGEQAALSADQAAQSVNYWRTAADQLLADSEAPDGSDARKAYAKLVSSQAGLLADHQLTAEAEQEFRIALEIYPASPEALFRYVNLLTGQSRADEALPLVEKAIKSSPDDQALQGLLNNLKSTIKQGK